MINANWPWIIGSEKKPAIIYVFADTHFGNPATDLDLLREHILMCKKEKAQWLHLGDWIEAITPRDSRYDVRSVPDAIEDSWELARVWFNPIRKQGIAMLSGNHEEMVERWYGSRTRSFAREMGVPYLGYSGFVNFRLSHNLDASPNKSYTFFLHHGHGMGALLGAKTINLHRMSHKYDADIYLIGHIHTFLRHTDAILGITKMSAKLPRLTDRFRHYASAPSYLKGHIDTNISTYAERKAMYPQPIGCLRIKFWYNSPRNAIGKRDIEWHVSIEPLLGDER